MACKCNAKIALLVSAIVGLVLIVVAAVLGFAVLPGVVDDLIEANVILDKEGTDQYDRFVKLPFPLNFTVYFFHINNAPDVMSGAAYPDVTEVGPIVYSKQLEKLNIEHNDDNTIKFDSNRFHQLLPDYSEVDESKEITVLNAPLVAVFQIFEGIASDIADKLGLIGEVIKDFLLDILINGYPQAFDLKADTVFINVKIGDYAFHGHKLCDPKITKGDARLLCALIRLKGSPTLQVLDNREISFSFFQHKNNTEEGSYEVENGVNDIMKLGDIVRFAGESRTKKWLDVDENGVQTKCNEVRGTDTTIFNPHNDKDSEFTIFNTDICRTVELAFTKEIEYEGIPGYRSTLKKSTMDWSLPENDCYCIKETKNLLGKKECLPSGFSDMNRCLGAPIVLSFPHFLWAEDESYTKTVTGLNPVEEDHNIYIDMEPNTGSPMVGHKRVQFNSILRNYGKRFKMLNKVKASVVPMVWIDEHVFIPDSLVDMIKSQYLTPVTAINITKWVLIGVGIAMTLGCGGWYIYKRRQVRQVTKEV